MLKFDDVFPRLLARDEFREWRQDMFMEQKITNTFSLAAYGGGVYGSVNGQQMQFPSLAVVVGLTAGASPAGAASTTALRPGLDMFAAGIVVNQQRTLVGPGQSIGSALFGRNNDLFPSKELIVQNQASLAISLTSLVTDAITVWITAHCYVPNRND